MKRRARLYDKEYSTLEIAVDIETCHNEGKFFRPGKQYISSEQITRERNIILIQYAPMTARSSKDVTILRWDWTRWDDRDAKILEKFSKLCNKYDRVKVYTKNGRRFDWPWINGRLAILGLTPLPPVTMVDVEELLRKNMNLNGYSLDYVSKLFGGSGKIKMIRQDWYDIENGDERKTIKMERYGAKDVIDTIKLYRKIHPYVPEVRTYTSIHVNNGMCPHCLRIGKKNVMQKRGQVEVLSGWKQRWFCKARNHPKDKRRWFTESRVVKDY